MKIIITFLYMILGITNIYGQKEIPHETILDNPKTKITTIETKKQKEKATLNITVTKIKSKNINIEVNPSKKILLCNLNENNVKINKNEQVFFVENIQDIPTTSTINGERRLNHLRNQMLFKSAGVVADNELTYNSNPKENKDGHKVVKVEYKNQPKKLYMTVLDNTGALKSVYNATLKSQDDDIPTSKRSTLDIVLFDEEIESNLNLVFSDNKNTSGKILVRPDDDKTHPSLARDTLSQNIFSTFKYSESPLDKNFHNSSFIEGRMLSPNGSIEPLDFTFKSNQKVGVCVNSSNYKLTTFIHNNFPGIEINLIRKKKLSKSEKISYIISLKNRNNQTIEDITVNLYINSGKIQDHFKQSKIGYMSSDIKDFWSKDNEDMILKLPTNNPQIPVYEIRDFASPNIHFNPINNYSVDGIGKFQSTFYNFNTGNQLADEVAPSNGIINKNITNIDLQLLKEYYHHREGSQTSIWWTPFNISFCNHQHNKYDMKFQFTVTKNPNYFYSEPSINIYGIPLINTFLIPTEVKNNSTVFCYSGIREYDIEERYNNLEIMYNNNRLNQYENKMSPFYIEENGSKFLFTKDKKTNTYYMKILKYNIPKTKQNIKYTIKYRTIDSDGTTKYYDNHCTIELQKFDPLWLYDEKRSTFSSNRTLKDIITEYLENKDFNNDVNIPLGKVYFNNLNIEALTQNNISPKDIQMNLDKFYYLDNGNNKVKVSITFGKNSSKTTLDYENRNFINNSIILKISKDDLKKMVIDHKKTSYKLYNSTGEDTLLNIGFNKNGDNINYWSKIKQNTSIDFYPLIANKIILNYNNNYPLLNKEYNLNGQFYVHSDNFYNQNINIIGNFPNKFKPIQDKTIMLNKDGTIINDSTNSSISGKTRNSNEITITHDNNGHTIFTLNKWNFKKLTDDILLKYYTYDQTNLYDYSEYVINLPDLDPYIYLDQNKTKLINYNKKTKEIRIERKKGCYQYLLGEVCLNDYDTEITKGDDDNIGIKLKTSENNEIFNGAFLSFEVNSHEYFNKGVSRKIYLNIPKDLPENEDFKIISDLKDSNKASSLPNKYILAIGRKGFYKEIINKIILSKKSLLEGESTIEFKPDYPLESVKYFNSCTLDSPNKLSFVKGYNNISIKNNIGDGLVKINKNYKVAILINNQLAQDAIIRDLNSKNSLPITIDNIASLRFLINKSGNIGISLDKWDFNKNISNDTIDIKIYDESNKLICIHTFRIITPISFFKIIDKNPMDFGSIIQGQKNINAKGNILFETTPGTNIQVSLSNLDKNNSLKIKHEHSDALTVKNINSYTTSEGNNFYRTNVIGSLSVPEHQTIGNYKGKIIVNISIKQ